MAFARPVFGADTERGRIGVHSRLHSLLLQTFHAAIVTAIFAPAVAAAARTLPPGATKAIAEVFGTVRGCRIDNLAVDGPTATLRLCEDTPGQRCFAVRLGDPQAGCGGEVTGPWCLEWTEGQPPRDLGDAIRKALGDSESAWIEPEFAPRTDHYAPGPGSSSLRFQTWAAAVLLIAGPMTVGAVVGRVLRKMRRRWIIFVLAVALPMTFCAINVLPFIGAWDIVSVAVLGAVGLFVGAMGRDPRATAVFGTASLVGLALLEWAVRVWLPVPPRFPSAEEAQFIVGPAGYDRGCLALDGSEDVDREMEHLRSPAGLEHRQKVGPLVVHLGDSLTFGTGVREEEAFPALLDQRFPEVVHANYGVWAVGTDFEYLLLQRILATRTPALVVLHVYVGNDFYDIDRPYECCDGGPLLLYPPGGPEPRCPSLRWGFSLTSRLGRSPPPYPLRVATAQSYAARYVATVFSRMAFFLDPPPNFINPEGDATEQGWDHFRQILAKMRDELRGRGIPLIVDLLPSRRALEAATPTEISSYLAGRRAAAIAADLGIPVLDAWSALEDAVKRDGASRYYLSENDIHFSPEGHRLVANWLAERLPPVEPVHRR